MEVDKKLEHRLRKEIIDTTQICVDYGLIRSSERHSQILKYSDWFAAN